MIIACSAGALKAIKNAMFRRAAKADGSPAVAEGKGKASAVRSLIASRKGADELVWNFDVTETPVASRGEDIGIAVTGYLYQRVSRTAIVLNSLDDADLCRIGEVARTAVEKTFEGMCVNPRATARYLQAADGLARDAAEKCGISLLRPYPDPPKRTLIVSNSDRSAASGLTKARNAHEARIFGDGHATVSHELVDGYAGYLLNNSPATYASGRTKRISTPLAETRAMAAAYAGSEPTPALELKLTLVDDGFLRRKHPDLSEADVPECWRTLLVPPDAPLSWLHETIQKAFDWYDYHLHRFSVGGYEARELLELLFEVELGVEKYDGETPAEKAARLEAAGGLARFEELTGLGARWVYGSFLPYAKSELLADDFPVEALPESDPVGLFLLGEQRYREILSAEDMEQVGRIEPSGTLYYNYDFGDDWELAIELTGVRMIPDRSLPQVAGGTGHTPPEDCGGLGGFKRFLEAYELVKSGNADADEDVIAEAEDTVAWARGVVGWRPFDPYTIAGTFDAPGNMS